MYNNPGPNGPFTTNVSSYFRRPSRVVKPSSRTSSPRNTGRRRMTTTGHFPARTRSVVDYQRASMPQLSQQQAMANRPISWHPNTMEEMAYLQLMPQQMIESEMASPYTTVDMSALVTPMSFPVMDEPQIQELISPLEDLSADDPANAYALSQDFLMETWLGNQQTKSLNHVEASMYPDIAYPTWYNFDQYEVSAAIPNDSASPNFISAPAYDATFAYDVEDTSSGKDELVGMGLYDSPADVQTSSLLFGNQFGSMARKTLKLEDAFEPAPASDDDDEDDGEYEDGDDEQDAPGEPDVMAPAPSEEHAIEIPAKDVHYTSPLTDRFYQPQNDMDLLKLQQWQLAQEGNLTWI